MSRDRIALAAALLIATLGAVTSWGLLSITTAVPGDRVATFFEQTCRGLTTVGCNETLRGPWARVPVVMPWPDTEGIPFVKRKSIPVAFFGVVYFCAHALWLVIVPPAVRRSRSGRRVPRCLAASGLAVSALLFAIMGTGFSPWCPWCIAVHAMNAALLPLIWRVTRTNGAAPVRVAGIIRPIAAAGAVVILVSGVLGNWHRERMAHLRTQARLTEASRVVSDIRRTGPMLLAAFEAEPVHVIERRPEEPPAGGSTLVVFTDFECSACAGNVEWIRETLPAQFGDQLTVLIRHYPLSNSCNRFVTGPGHAHACDAALAAEAVRQIGGHAAFQAFWPRLFGAHAPLSREVLLEIAEDVGLDRGAVADAMNEPETRARVQADIDLAHTLGIGGTPSYVLDGRVVPDLCRTPAFWAAAAARPTGLATGNELPGDDR